MRLDKLWIENFKNLKSVTIDFDERSLSTVLIGRNATAKSNLLEAIAWIFRNLDLLEDPPFRYRLEYEIRGMHARIDSDPNRDRDKVQVSANDKNIPYSLFKRENHQYLPSNVFGYYSGISKRFEKAFAKHRDIFYQRTIYFEEPPLRPLFFAKTLHGQYVLLAFFSFGDKESTKFLEEYFDIIDIDEISFVLKEPYWYNKIKHEDDLFWGARGVVRKFLDDLYSVSVHTEKERVRVRLPNRRSRTEERFSLTIENLDSLRKLASNYEGNVEFFKMLESTSISDLIHRLIIRVKKKGVDNNIEFTELSEGEQQLLIVLGLLRFMKEEESLFLLDEPDTHLNPAWKLEYLALLERVVGKLKNSHIIIATHDPLLIGGLKKEQIQIFSFKDEEKNIVISPPEIDPIGLGIDGLLTSELFGLETTLDLGTQKKLDSRKELVVKKEILKEDLSPDETKKLEKLNAELLDMGFVSTVRDPLYTVFLAAIRRYESREKIEFSALEKKKQVEIARKIIAEIKGDSK